MTGGVIGTGLFRHLTMIHQAGPLGAILAYAAGSLLVYCVMVSLGELSVAMPYRQLPHVCEAVHRPRLHHRHPVLAELGGGASPRSSYGRRAVDAAMVPAFAVPGVVGPLWWCSRSTVRAAVWSRWFASIKVFAIIAFMPACWRSAPYRLPVMGFRAVAGQLRGRRLVPRGIAPIFSTLLTVVFAFSGTEVVGVAAGETKDPSRAIPRPCTPRCCAWAIFFIGSILVMAALIPQIRPAWTEPVRAGVPVNRHAVRRRHHELRGGPCFSAANSGLYVCSRMVWSLAKERLIPERFARTNFRGVPVWAVLFSMAGSLLALLSSVIAASTVYLVLVAVSGLATLVVWFSVCVCHIRFRREWARDGHSADELGYRAPGFPVLPWLAIVMCIGALVLVVLDDTQRSTLYCMIPFVACCYAAYYALERQLKREKNA